MDRRIHFLTLLLSVTTSQALLAQTLSLDELDSALASSAAAKVNVPPVTDQDYYFSGQQNPNKVKLGKLLFFDKILSGNQNISCATCHHSLTGTGDGLSLPVGEGGQGLGVARNTGIGVDAIHERVPRNAPPIFNLGATEFEVMFHDGRVRVDPSQPSGFLSPAGDDLPLDLDNVLAVQAMFPVTSATEMAGQQGENPQADYAAAGNLPALWDYVAGKLRQIPDYVALFVEVFPDARTASDISYTHAANAIGAFEAVAWRFDNSPFDEYLRGAHGKNDPMSKKAKAGAALFYGSAGCSSCHAGKFQTDHAFHAIAMPQIGPGKGDGISGHEDFGLERVSGFAQDRFKFRTPTLRNVALTPPYGHDGAFDTLRGIIEHHLDCVNSLHNYSIEQAVMPSRADLDLIDQSVLSDPVLIEDIARANELSPVKLNDAEIDQLIAFLHALTDPAALDLRRAVPKALPSGLALHD